MAAGYKVGVYSSPASDALYRARTCAGAGIAGIGPHRFFLRRLNRRRGDISLTYFEYGTLSALWLFKRAQLDIVILEVGLGGRLDATNIVDADVAVVLVLRWIIPTGWARSRKYWSGKRYLSQRKTGSVGEPEMPSTIADVGRKKFSLQRQGVEWNYSVTDHDWTFSDAHGTLENLPLPLVPQPNAATALAAHCVPAGWRSVKMPFAAGCQRNFAGTFPDCERVATRYFDVAHNPHAAEYLTGRMKALPKNGRVLAVIGMLHDKDIAGTLAWLKSVVDDWYCAPLEGPRCHGRTTA